MNSRIIKQVHKNASKKLHKVKYAIWIGLKYNMPLGSPRFRD